MVKIPATAAGVPAIKEAIFEGININVTLIFSLQRYSEVIEAYVEGLERRVASGQPVERVASVASFFVSRVDSAVDKQLETIIRKESTRAERAHALLGTAAIANAKLAYAQFKSVFDSPDFEQLREVGARPQRPLWASTSTKNPAYSDVLYIEELIGQHTVNTVPPKTVLAFRDHGVAEARLEAGLSEARAQLQALAALGVSLDEVTSDLERDGVRSFSEAYSSLIETVGERADGMRGEIGSVAPELARTLELLDTDRVAARFWRVDPDLWPETTDGSVIKMRLEWLEAELDDYLSQAKQVAQKVDSEKIAQIGWIGSAQVLDSIAEAASGERSVVSLETLDPNELRSFARKTPVDSTIFVAQSRAAVDPATTIKLTDVWRRASNRLGDEASQHFIVVTPENSQLVEWAGERNIDRIEEWNHSSEAAISAGGFLLASLLGADPNDLAEGAASMRKLSSPGAAAALNPALYLGAALAAAGRSLSIVADPSISSRAEWLAKYLQARIQISNRAGTPRADDDGLVYLRLDGEIEEEVRAQETPLIILQTEPGLPGIGSDSVQWEVGAGVAAHLLSDPTYAGAPLLPAWNRLAKMVERFQKRGNFGYLKPSWTADYGSVWWSWKGQGRAAEPASLSRLAALALQMLNSSSALFVGIYQSRSSSALKALSTLSDRLAAARGVSVVSEFSRPPEAKFSGGFSLLVGGDPKKDTEVQAHEFTLGDLQSASMIADFEQAKEAGGEACAILLKEPEDINRLLMAIAEQADDVSIRSEEEYSATEAKD